MAQQLPVHKAFHDMHHHHQQDFLLPKHTDPVKQHTHTNTMNLTVTHMHTHTHPFNSPLSGTTWVSQYQKSKTNLDLLEQETVSGSGISWAICKSTSPQADNHASTPRSHHSVFYRPDALSATQPTASNH